MTIRDDTGIMCERAVIIVERTVLVAATVVAATLGIS